MKQLETTHKIKESVNSMTVTIAAICFLLGGMLIFLSSQTAEWWGGHVTWQSFSRDLGSLIFMTSGLTLVWEFLNRRAFLDEIIAKTNLSANIASAGLSFVTDAFSDEAIEWREYFQGTQRLTLFAGYARTWRNTHLSKIESLLNRGGQVVVFLPDPEKLVLVQELSRRYNVEDAEVRRLITESARDFANLQPQEGAGKITVRFVNSTPQYSFYFFDRLAVFALYDHNVERRTPVPTFICTENGTIYNFIKKDIASLQAISREDAVLPAEAVPENI